MLSISDLIREVEKLGIRLWIDETGVHAEPGWRLPQDMRDELRARKDEVSKYLATQGESVIADAEERLHIINSIPAPEISEAEKREAIIRAGRHTPLPSGGVLVVNGVNSMSHYMRQLRRLNEQRQAAERGDAAEGRYRTNFDIFKD